MNHDSVFQTIIVGVTNVQELTPYGRTVLAHGESLLILHYGGLVYTLFRSYLIRIDTTMRNPDRQTTFHFKQFDISNCKSAMKVGTDGVLLGSWAFAGVASDSSLRILDVGCGTGVIALMLAQRFPKAEITGVEIDPNAADEASSNFASSPWGDRLKVVCKDFLEFPGASDDTEMDIYMNSFDLVVSNPPFFTNGALAPDEARRVARHASSLSLSSLTKHAVELLKPGGSLGVIVPIEQFESLSFCAALSRLTMTRQCHVKTVEYKPARRVLCEFSTDFSACCCHQPHQLSLRHPSGEPSEEYRDLVKDFYIKL